MAPTADGIHRRRAAPRWAPPARDRWRSSPLFAPPEQTGEELGHLRPGLLGGQLGVGPHHHGGAEVDHLLHGHLSGKGSLLITVFAVVLAGRAAPLRAAKGRIVDGHAAGLTKGVIHVRFLL